MTVRTWSSLIQRAKALFLSTGRGDISGADLRTWVVDLVDSIEAAVNGYVSARTLDAYVKRVELEGHEDDFFPAYQETMLEAGVLDKRYAFALASGDGSAQPVTADIYINMGAVAAGARTLIVSGEQWGAIPNDDPSTPDPPTVALTGALAAGVKTIQSVQPHDDVNYVTLASTGAATKVGAGNGAWWYVPVAVTVHGDLDDIPVDNFGNEWVLRSVDPSTLDLDLPARAIANPPWAVRTLANLATVAQAGAQKIVAAFEGLNTAWLTRLRRIVQGNNETTVIRLKRVAGLPANPGEIQLPTIGNDVVAGSAQVIFPAADKAGTALPLADMLSYVAGDFYDYKSAELEITGSGINLFQGQTYQFAFTAAPGYVFANADFPAVNETADATFEGRDLHVRMLVQAALKRAATNLAGAGGAAGQVWAYVSSSTNAAWTRLLDVLKLDASTAAKKAAYQAALATGRLQISVAGSGGKVLTAAQAAYDSLELTGALTGTRTLTLPAAPTGLRLIRHLATGDQTLQVKAAGQSDAAAIPLAQGDNIICHHGGSLDLKDRMRRWVNADIGGAVENIANNLHDDDWVSVTVEGTKTGYSPGTASLRKRFGDLDADERLLLEPSSNANAVIVSKDGTNLQAKRGSGLAGASSVVYAERRTYSTLAIS